MRKIICIVQARTDSTRLPKKVLRPLLNLPMIIQQLQRVSQCKRLDRLILATSDQQSDDTLAKTIKEYGFECFRGNKDDVLARFYKLCSELGLNDDDIIIRLTGDCPLQGASIIDELIDFFIKRDIDYVANCIDPVYPDGFDTEIFNFKSLTQASIEAIKPSEREHVTPYIYNSGLFKTANLQKEIKMNHLRLTVDEEDDFQLITSIFNHFGHNRFTYEEIIRYLSRHQELTQLNAHIKRNEGYEKSLLEDTDTDERTK